MKYDERLLSEETKMLISNLEERVSPFRDTIVTNKPEPHCSKQIVFPGRN